MNNINVNEQYGSINAYFVYCDENEELCKTCNI